MEDYAEARILARFEKYDEFIGLQKSILRFDFDKELSEEERRNDVLARGALFRTLAEYQEQSYLLDPFLEELVSPVVNQLKERAFALAQDDPDLKRASALSRISLILYHYIKCRGYKTIIRFFPHEIGDLSIALNLLRHLNELESSLLWSLQYVVLLWISLICMIPFDFSQFDEPDHLGEAAAAIEAEAKKCLGKSGLEREGAALTLSRFYVRKDMALRLPAFLTWCDELAYAEHNIFESIGALQTVCDIMKTAPIEIALAYVPAVLALGKLVEGNKVLMNNAIARKLRIKLISRAGLRLLPTTSIANRRRGRVLSAKGHEEAHQPLSDDDIDIPEEIESVLEDVFPGLQDKDTIVRWASAKAIARISERLPTEFIGQVVDTAINLFTIHSTGVASLYDMPAIAESTWQGACLACAELARKGLIPNGTLDSLTDWMTKALSFDIRKGAHSIGSSVRDSAAYVLWSLARAYSPSVLEPFSQMLAKKLVAVSVYDREVHIRRAASATFQEHVGRTSLFPHGIDVIRKTDFFVVGIRRTAFLTAATQTAEHEFYRPCLIDHVLTITLRHWDHSMRQLGAQSLRQICRLDLPTLGPKCARRIRPLLTTSDSSDVHGALLALTELAAEFYEAKSNHSLEEHRRAIFTFLTDVPLDTILSPRQDLITAAACQLIAQSISFHEIQLDSKSSVPNWRKIIDNGLKHRVMLVQEAAASAMAKISKLRAVNQTIYLDTSIRDFRAGSPGVQQSLARLIGALDYTAHDHGLKDAIACLLQSVDKTSSRRMSSVEARRNCYTSITQILACVIGKIQSFLTPAETRSLFDALICGLEDYSVDERGDVGSWIRIACLQGLSKFATTMFRNADHIDNFEEYFPQERYHAAVAGILKQGVERLDNVRQQAGEVIGVLLKEPLPPVPIAEALRIHGESLLKSLFIGETKETWGWQDSSWLFPRAVRILEIKEYWTDVMAGLLLSVNSKTDSTQRPVAKSLAAYVQKLPLVTENDTLDLRTLVEHLISRAKANLGSNNNVLPVLQMFNVLLEADALLPLASDEEGLKNLQVLLSITTRGASKLKNVHRIHESMKTAVNLLSVPQLYATCVPRLVDFLTNEYPRIRGDTAEYLYLTLQTRDFDRETDEAEELLAETEWMSDGLEIVREAAQQVVQLLL